MAPQNLFIWHVDSAYSRAIKWLLLSLEVRHEDRVVQWQELRSDPVLSSINPKRQVPAFLFENRPFFDSFFISLHFLGEEWTQTRDAALFRLADSDIAEAMRGLYRVHRYRKQPELKDTLLLHSLREEAWQSWYRCLVWCDALLENQRLNQAAAGVGAVLLHAMVACMIYFDKEVLSSLNQPLLSLLANIESNEHYKTMAKASNGQQRVPFYIVTH